MSLTIERLSRVHLRDRFDCGEPTLNNYLQRMAMQNDERRIGRTYVAVGEDDPHVLGYYTLATSKIVFEDLPAGTAKKLPPRMPVPVVLLGRLAVDNSQKGKGLGGHLLLHALWRTQQIARQVGIFAVEVDALHDTAKAFYLKYGFTPLIDDPLHLFLSLKAVEALNLDFDRTAPNTAEPER